jgi:hypothetical protein
MSGSTPAAVARSNEPAAVAIVRPPILLELRIGEKLRRLAVELQRSCRAHALFIGLVLVYLAASAVVPPLFSARPVSHPSFFNARFLWFHAGILGLLTLCYVMWVMAVVRPPRLASYLHTELRTRFLTAERIAAVLPVLLLYPAFVSAFTVLKASIPAIHPFDWDPQFAAWDKALHGGRHPWEWLQPVLGHPYATAAIDSVYLLWFYVGAGVLLWQTLSLRRPRLRMQYLLSTILLWMLLGSLAATVLSSVGPCYYGRVTGLPDPFVPLMDYLRSADAVVPMVALRVQESLWHIHADPNAAVQYGISAMPSLHVAVSFSFSLLGFAISRRLGLLFGLLAAATLIGSVHLGWHYAIDGYAGILGAYVIWRAVGWLLGRPAVATLLWGERGAELE